MDKQLLNDSFEWEYGIKVVFVPWHIQLWDFAWLYCNLWKAVLWSDSLFTLFLQNSQETIQWTSVYNKEGSGKENVQEIQRFDVTSTSIWAWEHNLRFEKKHSLTVVPQGRDDLGKHGAQSKGLSLLIVFKLKLETCYHKSLWAPHLSLISHYDHTFYLTI
jgi:hypothetical protein